MGNVAHTPGPWEVTDEAVLSKDINDYGNWIVADCRRELTDQDRANLRLIAAAPEILDILCRALPYVEDLRYDETYKPGHIKKFTDEIRAAIAKATGNA